jgi:hypothetical protein
MLYGRRIYMYRQSRDVRACVHTQTHPHTSHISPVLNLASLLYLTLGSPASPCEEPEPCGPLLRRYCAIRSRSEPPCSLQPLKELVLSRRSVRLSGTIITLPDTKCVWAIERRGNRLQIRYMPIRITVLLQESKQAAFFCRPAESPDSPT